MDLPRHPPGRFCRVSRGRLRHSAPQGSMIDTPAALPAEASSLNSLFKDRHLVPTGTGDEAPYIPPEPPGHLSAT
jgi:hypothetical protein